MRPARKKKWAVYEKKWAVYEKKRAAFFKMEPPFKKMEAPFRKKVPTVYGMLSYVKQISIIQEKALL